MPRVEAVASELSLPLLVPVEQAGGGSSFASEEQLVTVIAERVFNAGSATPIPVLALRAAEQVLVPTQLPSHDMGGRGGCSSEVAPPAREIAAVAVPASRSPGVAYGDDGPSDECCFCIACCCCVGVTSFALMVAP